MPRKATHMSSARVWSSIGPYLSSTRFTPRMTCAKACNAKRLNPSGIMAFRAKRKGSPPGSGEPTPMVGLEDEVAREPGHQHRHNKQPHGREAADQRPGSAPAAVIQRSEARR